VRRDADEHIDALKMVVGEYIASPGDPNVVDWEFIAKRNMQKNEAWRVEHKGRHARALARLAESRYVIQPKAPRR
jgi:hypothetical protein